MDTTTNSLTGLSKAWVSMRMTNSYYVANKIISVILSTALACITLSYKPMIQEYANAVAADPTSNENEEAYKFIYWFLFIFYSFQAIDELIELYAVYFKREKGALGLLFEMNYFLGLAVSIYIAIFVFGNSAPAIAEYAALYNWLVFQMIILFVGVALSIFIYACMKSMQDKLTRKAVHVEKSD
uniref:Uncharacterized protein n=1 Tax=Strombidinopsis acuminata TaxID=141414 RepID=A0A7S3WRH9_9SPIT|mmetsp:Transcript_53026/g.72593  ORF Transcript_53026/g.72593 Transcript_53026/m.72593 type:complete len:184 (+) Transcript_53026:35-586(+)|eukprot:CAMPEP_0176371604 /NCGR_PEP_ID=MMETSP0126-20121128/24810_1 /TAXON_ID=141414 ORGANISM="Strombidinopsis acuminatum, Strain SPMC142" /NCGR_SAMPLE_ID=MMETSP0126 /ASSEMBLY_ACC=CAM_ASM_000229 /LENGTH=183 /DNA_ID=CAMNT_0017731119 /DNA_START=36 /DNA_END=587 /DNA_ORIENTATION=+